MVSDALVDRERAEGQEVVQPTDVSDPSYFHKVVDCQWACPAHTPVPEYIRKIALQFRKMKRLWVGQGLDGLLTRRDAEADLVLSAA